MQKCKSPLFFATSTTGLAHRLLDSSVTCPLSISFTIFAICGCTQKECAMAVVWQEGCLLFQSGAGHLSLSPAHLSQQQKHNWLPKCKIWVTLLPLMRGLSHKHSPFWKAPALAHDQGARHTFEIALRSRQCLLHQEVAVKQPVLTMGRHTTGQNTHGLNLLGGVMSTTS